jgi:hypothetical protein
MVKFASYVPKEIERPRVYLSARAKVTPYKVAFSASLSQSCNSMQVPKHKDA